MHWTMHYDGTILNFGLPWTAPGLQSRILFFWDYSKVGLGMSQRWLGLKQFGGWGYWRSYACGDVNVWVSSYIGLRKQEGLSHMSGKEYSNGYKWCTSVDVMMGNTWSNCLSKGGRHTQFDTKSDRSFLRKVCVKSVVTTHHSTHSPVDCFSAGIGGHHTHTHTFSNSLRALPLLTLVTTQIDTHSGRPMGLWCKVNEMEGMGGGWIGLDWNYLGCGW